MSNYSVLDDSVKNFREHSHVIKSQGNYLERAFGFFSCKKILSNFNVRILTSGLEKLPRAGQSEGRRILLVPSHRSYLDPILVHHVLTLAGHPQPRVAALDFIAATPLAPLFKKCGAVFIKGDWRSTEYREKMNEKLRELTDQGEWLEFYPEGQRSLSGKQMDPRRGLFTALMADKPCTIYPINISYTRLIEDREFITKRRGFQIKNTIQSLFLPGGGAGDVYFTVGDPIHTNPGDNAQATAMTVTRSIIKNNVLHGTDLLAVMLLDHQEHIPLAEIQQEMEWLGAALAHRGIIVTDTKIDPILKLLKHAVTVKKGVVQIRDKTLLIYYRNRAMYALSDLAATPPMLRKEALWSPSRNPRGRDSKRLKQIAKRAIEPTVFLYKYLMDKVQEGETSIKELRRSTEDNPHCCYETVNNFITILKEDKLAVVDGDLITLL